LCRVKIIEEIGFATLMGSIIVGKRTDYDPTRPIPPSNIPFVLLGTAFLWVGWLGFNGGSALTAGGTASLAVANSTISAAAGFITWLMLDSITHLRPSAVGAATGAGEVSQ
jgi:Amt family ammonium transporter